MIRTSLLVAALAGLPAAGHAAIYKWIDETGTTVYSNRPPEDPKLAKQAKIVMKDEGALTPSQAALAEATRRQRELEERVANLERQLAAQQYAPPPQYYPAPAPPPPDYYGDSYYPYYGAYGYAYRTYPVSVLVTGRRFAGHRFVSEPARFRSSRMGARRR